MGNKVDMQAGSDRSDRGRRKNGPRRAADRGREIVKGLLAGELADYSEIDYDFDGHHLRLMARGEDVEGLMRGLATRAYFDAERNISSTAAALGVDRRTVRNRLRVIEELLGRPPHRRHRHPRRQPPAGAARA
jgi:hypothetical protein